MVQANAGDMTGFTQTSHSTALSRDERSSIRSSSIGVRNCALGLLMVLLTCCEAVSAEDGSLLASANTLEALVVAVGFVPSYREVAAVSARVFAKRAQGSDTQTAEVMRKVAGSDLTAAKPCIANVYERQAFTESEASQLTVFFTSALGRKLLAESQRMHLASIEALSPQRADTTMFTTEEKQELAVSNQKAAFKKYGRMVASREAAKAMMVCIYRVAGIDVPGLQ